VASAYAIVVEFFQNSNYIDMCDTLVGDTVVGVDLLLVGCGYRDGFYREFFFKNGVEGTHYHDWVGWMVPPLS